MILSTLGWLVAFGLLALVASSAWHGFREKSRGPWIAAGIYACSAVVVLTIVGVLGWLTALVLAVLVSGATAGLAQQAAGRAPPARPSVMRARASATSAPTCGASGGGSWPGCAASVLSRKRPARRLSLQRPSRPGRS